MDIEEFRQQLGKVSDFLYDYRKNFANHRVTPGDDIKAHFLKKIMSDEAPMEGESFDSIFKEFKEKIMPGTVHWNHPNFFAYYPSGNSYPAILADLLSTGTNQIGFSWKSSPALTEHEQLVMNMYAKVLDLPKTFLYDETNEETGGGAMQGSASDCILLALLAARARAVKMLKGGNEFIHESVFLPHMVAYTSKEAHSCVQKAAKIAIIKLRVLETDEHGVLQGETLAKAIEHDVNVEQLTPIFVAATVGTTGTCAFDKIYDIGKVCKKYETIWYHVDGAYGGNAFILEELRKYKSGLEFADSFNTNANKMLLTNFDSSCFWVRRMKDLKDAMVVNPTYLEKSADEGEELRNYGVPLSRRFRSLKLWCVLRNYGIRGLQTYVRNHISVAKHFASLIQSDKRFALENDVILGLVCFRLLMPSESSETNDKINVEFLQRMNASGEIHMVPTTFHGNYIIRFCVTNDKATDKDMDDAWTKIQRFATGVLDDFAVKRLKFQKYGARSLQSRFSFARLVSRKDYNAHNASVNLRDDATPTYVINTSDEDHSNGSYGYN